MAEDEGRVVFTVGHSNHALETFLELLHQHQIDVLVDTRSRPSSRYVPHFNHDALRPAVEQSGARFVFLGQELGGRPDGAAFYDDEGHVRYDMVAQTPEFLNGVAKVERGASQHRIALLCSEENPAICHRRLLIGRVLSERGTQVVHIRGDGRLQTEAELTAEETAGEDDGGQQSLFGDEEELTAWRSIQSVSRKKQPGSSSKR